MNVANIRALARKLRRLRHEEHYDQGTWISKTTCGTAACIAGHAALLGGCKPMPHDNKFVRDPEGKVIPIWEFASKWLGFRDEPLGLFSSTPSHDWPPEFANRWSDAQYGLSKERPSRIAADLLDAIADKSVKLQRYD